MKKKIAFSACLFFLVFSPAWPQFGGQEAARPRVVAQVAPASGEVDFRFQVPAGYHITDLKNKFFAITLAGNGFAELARTVFPAGVPYGEESVFKGEFSVRVFLKRLRPVTAPVVLDFDVSFQVCQEYPKELCYAPDQTRVQVAIQPGFLSAPPPAGQPLARRLENLIRGRMGSASFPLFLLVFAAGFLASLTPCVYPVIPIVMGFVGGRSQRTKAEGL